MMRIKLELEDSSSLSLEDRKPPLYIGKIKLMKSENFKKENDNDQDVKEEESEIDESTKMDVFSNRLFKCDQCESTFNRKFALKRHLKEVHCKGECFECEIEQCGKSFKSQRSLRYHRERAHVKGDNFSKPFECDLCKAKYKKIENLRRHKRVHSDDRPFKCDKCEWAFKNSWALKWHEVIHSDVRPFKCDKCEWSFKKNKDLRKHKWIHTDVRPFKCEKCDKSFKRWTILKRHKNEIHSATGPYKCDKCDASYNRRSTFRKHMARHESLIKFENNQRVEISLRDNNESNLGRETYGCDAAAGESNASAIQSCYVKLIRLTQSRMDYYLNP